MNDGSSGIRPKALSWIVLAALSLAGCARPGGDRHGNWKTTRAPADIRQFPSLGKGKEITPGIMFQEVSLPRGAQSSRLWVYLPKQPPKHRLPCVLIGPAGSRLFHGMGLAEGDRPEHLPYVRAGFAVVAYEIEGELPENAGETEILQAAREFQQAGAGWINAHEALDFAIGRAGVNQYRIYTAGHSSAATLSLLAAGRENRISGCIAYAPVTDVVEHLGDPVVAPLSRAIPGFREFLVKSSPVTNMAKLRCPVFLFHAEDDGNVPIGRTAAFAEALKKTNPRVTFVRVPDGDHYDSMIRQGIPRAIQWLQSLSR